MHALLKSAAGLAALAALGFAVPHPAAAQAAYSFTTFDSPFNTAGGTTVNSLSNAGSIVGFTGANPFTNFLRSPNGTFTDLTSLLGTADNANGINSDGEIVGFNTSTNGAFQLNGTTLTGLPLVDSTTTSEAAFGVNDFGLIVGQYADSATGTTPGFVDSAGKFTTIAPPSGFSVVNAQGINSNGLVVGFYGNGGSVSHGFTYNYVSKVFTPIGDPNVSGFQFSQVLAVNDSGIAAGYYGTTNNLQHGFLYNTNTGQYDFLDDPNVAPGGSAVMQITGINNAGGIAGFYSDANGVQHGFTANAVPEPAPVALLALGLPLIGLIARRRPARA